MAFHPNKDLTLMLHPYLFVLKEGKEIKTDLLDYSLMMLQVTSPEVIRSPDVTPLFIPNYDKLPFSQRSL